MLHVDEFIDGTKKIGHTPEENYARFVLMLFRLNASLKAAFDVHIKQFKLFCVYENVKYRVTGASRMGDVYLTRDYNQEIGYQKRVDVAECSQWSKE